MVEKKKNSSVFTRLRKVEEKIGRLFNNLPGMAYSGFIVPEWTMIFVSSGCFELTGYDPEDLVNNKTVSYGDIVHPEDREYVWKKVSETIGKRDPFELEYRIIDKNGNIKWVWERGISVYDDDLGQNIFEGFISDITHRKLVEQRIKDAKSKFEALLNHLQTGVFYINKDGEIQETNVALIKILGSPSAEETKKINIFEFQPLVEFGYTGKLQECIATGNIVYGEGEYRSKWGKRIYINYYFVPIKIDGKVDGVLASIEDVSRKKRNEEELQKMQKLESIGTLAGGIAHDFNNLLTSVFGNISFAKMSLESGHVALKSLEQAEKAMDRATSLTRQLLTFSKGGEPLKEPVDIGELIRETVKFDLSGSNVKLDIAVSSELSLVMADKGQLNQVVSNLVINAQQSMPEGGILKISLGNILLNKREVPNLEEGRYVKIEFRDEGSGIEKKYLEKIFYPYFTTKQSGSGLGLSMVFSIVKKHDGYITVDSELGTGSCFTVFLPAMEDMVSIDELEKIQDRIASHRTLKILIMDDEQSILDLLTDVFELEGHSVQTALNGSSAVRKFSESIQVGKPFDLVIMDLTIPGEMGGKEAVKYILELDPNAKCIVSSGYASDSVMADYAKFGFKAAVAKPFKIEDLLKVITGIA